MTREEFECVLGKLDGQTKYIYYHLMGEPLLHPQLPEFIKMSGERGYKSIITTNGTLLSRRGDEIIAAGIHKINISLHSFEEESEDGHNAYLSGIVDFAKKAAEAGIIVVLRFWNRGVDGTQNDFALDSLKENIEGEWKENTRGIKVRDKIFIDFGERFEWPDPALPECDAESDLFCYGLRDQIGILSDGTVVPCCLDADANINLGNLFRAELDEIISSPRAKAIYDGFTRRRAYESLCRKCGYAKRFSK
jgi:radical SAM protein with 4Fe4S-binding SPASM domain